MVRQSSRDVPVASFGRAAGSAREARVLHPGWPAPPGVRAAFTLRHGGVSTGPYRSLNLGARGGDDPAAVAENRRILMRELALPSGPVWLHQVHGARAVTLPCAEPEPRADAAVTRASGVVCAALAADCLPVLLCDERAGVVAAAHAGWRGLAAGVVEAAVAATAVAPRRLLAWLGPAIGPDAFEVGAEVRTAFTANDPGAEECFRPIVPGEPSMVLQSSPAIRGRAFARHASSAREAAALTPDKFLANLYALARRRLAATGVTRVYGGTHCTFSEPQAFFSYRRDGACGRMATLIWLA